MVTMVVASTEAREAQVVTTAAYTTTPITAVWILPRQCRRGENKGTAFVTSAKKSDTTCAGTPNSTRNLQ